jgi:hypothetical protein
MFGKLMVALAFDGSFCVIFALSHTITASRLAPLSAESV